MHHPAERSGKHNLWLADQEHGGHWQALQKLRISKNLEAKGSSVLPHEAWEWGGGTLGTNENALWIAITGESGESGMRGKGICTTRSQK